MVQLTEVEDDHFKEQAARSAAQENDDDYTDTESEISTDSEFDPSSETFGDRIYALRDIVPPTARAYIGGKMSTCHSATATVLGFTGKALWVVATSALLFAVPFTLAFAEDQMMAVTEQEQKMREMGGELLTAGGADGQDQGGTSTAAQVSTMLGESGKEGKAAL